MNDMTRITCALGRLAGPVLLLALGLAVSAGASAQAVRIELGTGGDDLRGGDDNVRIRLYDNDGRLVGETVNANRSQTWGGGSINTVPVLLSSGRGRDLGAIELETSFRGGFDGDNWNLDSLRVVDPSSRQILFEARGGPLFRFTGDQRVQRYTFVNDACEVDAQCSDNRADNGDERCLASPRRLDGRDLRQCVAGSAPDCGPGEHRSAEGCVRATQDADGDGSVAIASGGTDCDDQDAGRFPGNPEICDNHGKDEDCDVNTVGERDLDADGHNSSACYNWGVPPGR